MSEEFSGDFLQWLRGFYYVVQTGSFSRAGEVMNRKQSSITYQVKKLEDTLGVSLLHRKSNPLRLTPEGSQLYPIATKIFSLLQQIRTEIAHNNELRGQISIIASYGVAAQYLPSKIKEYRQKFPNIEIDVLPERAAFIQQSYAAEKSNFVIAQQDLLPPDALFYPVFSTDLVLVTPKNWQTPPPSPITLEYIASQPIIGLVREQPLDYCVMTELQKRHLSIKVEQYTGFFLTVLQYVSLELGISVVDKIQADTYGFDLNTYSLSHLFAPRIYGIAYRPHQYIPPHVRSFINFLQEDYQESL